VVFTAAWLTGSLLQTGYGAMSVFGAGSFRSLPYPLPSGGVPA
jgi:hypothetical protein